MKTKKALMKNEAIQRYQKKEEKKKRGMSSERRNDWIL